MIGYLKPLWDRVTGRDRVEESRHRLEEAVEEKTDEELKRVEVLEEVKWHNWRTLKDGGLVDAAREEWAAAQELSHRRTELQNKKARLREMHGDDVAFEVMGEDR